MKTPNRLHHIAPLDGLRGLAILAVLCFHSMQGTVEQNAWGRAFHKTINQGWVGVDLFFVLSGFLITSVLLDSRTAENYFSVFYIRRALRLFPVYYLAVAFMFLVAGPLAHHSGAIGRLFIRWSPEGDVAHEQGWYWLNISNLRSAFYPSRIPTLTIFWTLALEEQFYLVWPACVRYLRSKMLLLLCAGSVALIALSRLLPAVQAQDRIHPNFLYRMTPFHMEGLFAGAALGICFYHGWKWPQLTRAAWIAIPLSLLGLALVAAFPHSYLAASHVEFSLLALLFSAIVWLCVLPDRPAAFAALGRSSLLRGFGRYSYFIYVFQIWVLSFIPEADGKVMVKLGYHSPGSIFFSIARTVVWVAIMYGLGALSWRYFEGPILRLKSKFPMRYLKGDRATGLQSAASVQ